MKIDYDLIKAAFLPMVGWRQPLDPSKTKLVDLYTSTTGRYYNDVHPSMKFNQLSSLCEDDTNYTYPIYSAGTEYSFGDVVEDGGTNYIYFNQTASTGNTPSSSPTYWREYEVLTETLRRETEAGISNTIWDWYTRKSKLKTAKDVLANGYLVKTTGNIADVNANQGKVRFIEITPYQSLAMKVRPYKIGLQFEQAQSIEVKIFKSGQYSPIHTESFSYTNAKSMQWFDLSVELDAGFRYWIAYDESAVTGGSINGMVDRGYDYDYIYAPLGDYFDAVGGSHPGDFTNLWDLDNNSYDTHNNYGLNLKVSVECDLTQFIIDQADSFIQAIMLNVAIGVLKKLALNPEDRVNRHENGVDLAWTMNEVNGDPRGNSKMDRSVNKKYEDAIDSIQFDRSKIDSICLPCSNRGLKITAH